MFSVLTLRRWALGLIAYRNTTDGAVASRRFGVIFLRRTNLVFRIFYLNSKRNLEVSTISKNEHLINEEITVAQVRLVGEDGEQLGIVSNETAQNISIEKGLDLVMIAPKAEPPVCRIMDYGKFKFEQEKREKEAKKKQQVVEVKEVQLSCNIGEHDFQTKLKHAIRFLGDGNKVKVCVRFHGREMRHTELGMEVVMKFAEAASEYAQIDKKPVLEGRNLTMFLSPVKQ